jgi:hypothetical protein
MVLENLISSGFSSKDAEKIHLNGGFHHKRKSCEKLADLWSEISDIYGCTPEDVNGAILSHPPFAGLSHSRVLSDAVAVYGANNESRIKSAILSFPQFAGLSHSRVLSDAVAVYGSDNESRIKSVILSFPQFAGLSHSRVLSDAVAVYGANNKARIKSVILSFPPFAGLSHSRVLSDAIAVYGSDNESRIKRAILSHPPFAGLNHSRVLRQKTRLGKMAGLTDEKTKDWLLSMPALAGYSVKRYLAAFDIARQLEKEGFSQDEKMIEAFFLYYSKSPYVPESNRKRISQMDSDIEPPLLVYMRKRLIRNHNHQ